MDDTRFETLVQCAKHWMVENQIHPDPAGPYASSDNGFLFEAERAYFVAMKDLATA